jgi:hypothetical protein
MERHLTRLSLISALALASAEPFNRLEHLGEIVYGLPVSITPDTANQHQLTYSGPNVFGIPAGVPHD